MPRRPLTAIAHTAVAGVLGAGDLAIDATVGNGHDTLFLAGQVHPGGRVAGFDIQADALQAARTRLRDAGLEEGVTLYARGHERLVDSVPADWRERVGAVMFNLGYLPGGDKRRVTRAATTLAAFDQACSLLRRGGLVTLLVYRGHAGGSDEAAAVAARLDRLSSDFAVTTEDSPGPVLYLVSRR